ncbi:YggT family protein [Candidatus Kaiserbacteria bacterium CG10_big_fil_rev_8_21_14_0_10_59_10]|uniref:YggT family protein n=1 Tax=Candidatus Kaiserbacteria bacterium CG10_big_fil_rev_8_21_14_0_10_59_10 TaxID=1974612 RepID=A0A2H0U728_9BACT|nr:MAG: YggT family protein [Candidatus Kaiserbacteria bacterium CG10_big_fil_rev_8_21_14_0_10_59_10]
MHATHSYHSVRIVARVIDVIIGIVVLALGVRLLLRFFGASPAAPFVAWIYGITDGLLRPFANMFPPAPLNGYVLEFSTIIAMIVYAILGWLIIRLLSLVIGSLFPPHDHTRVP